ECFAFRDYGAALVVFHKRGDVRRRRNLGAFGFVGRNEQAYGAIDGSEISGRDPLNIGGRYFLEPIAVEEIESPIALRHPLTQLESYALSRVQSKIDIL